MSKKIDFSVQGMDILGLDEKKVEPVPVQKQSPAKVSKQAPVNRKPERKIDKEKENSGSISSRLILPEKKEIKSEGKYFKLKPSIAAAASEKAREMGTSLNEIVNQLLQLWVEEK